MGRGVIDTLLIGFIWFERKKPMSANNRIYKPPWLCSILSNCKYYIFCILCRTCRKYIDKNIISVVRYLKMNIVCQSYRNKRGDFLHLQMFRLCWLNIGFSRKRLYKKQPQVCFFEKIRLERLNLMFAKRSLFVFKTTNQRKRYRLWSISITNNN